MEPREKGSRLSPEKLAFLSFGWKTETGNERAGQWHNNDSRISENESITNCNKSNLLRFRRRCQSS